MKHPRRILHVVPSLGAGGTERNCAHLASGLRSVDGFENHIVAARLGDASFQNIFEKLSAARVEILPTGRLARLRAFVSILRACEVDAIVFHFLNIDQALMACVARIIGNPMLVAAAGNPAPETTQGRWKMKAMIGLNRLACCPIISASKWIESTLLQVAKLPERSCVVYNGVDMASFNLPQPDQTRSFIQDKLVLGMVARLDKIKDHLTLFEGLALFARQSSDIEFELRVIGDGPLRVQLEGLSAEMGLADRVRFLGTRNDVPAQLSELNAFVFSTTRREGFGNVLIEALAAGVPIISSDVPSSREVLRGGEFGKLLPSNDATGWADALASLWYNGPEVVIPESAVVDAAYGIDQFRDGYLNALGAQLQDICPK